MKYWNIAVGVEAEPLQFMQRDDDRPTAHFEEVRYSVHVEMAGEAAREEYDMDDDEELIVIGDECHVVPEIQLTEKPRFPRTESARFYDDLDDLKENLA